MGYNIKLLRFSILFRMINFLLRFVSTLPLTAVEIETTTICNRRCSYCPNCDNVRPKGFMKEDIFYRIIDSLKKYNFKGRISPHFYGEPLLDERLERFIIYIKNNLQGATVKLYTNGDLLSIERYLSLKEAGVDTFRISQHSPKPLESLTRTLEYIKEKMPELYKVEYLDYYNDDSNKNNRGGLVSIETKKKSRCFLVNQLTFDYLGNAVLCCNDYFSSITFGNIKEKDVEEIWDDKNYKKMRNIIHNGFWPYEICKICSGSS